MHDRQYWVYILSNARHTVLYTGVTGDLLKRIYEHRSHAIRGFTARYNVVQLVYYEACPEVESAIAREKQIKAGSRARKVALIEGMNPEWADLYPRLIG